MKCGAKIRFDGLSGQEVWILVKKHVKEYGLSLAASSYHEDHWLGYICGELNTIVQMLDMLAHAGFQIEIISFR